MMPQQFFPSYMTPAYNDIVRQQQNMMYLSAQNQNRPQFGYNMPTASDQGNSPFPFPSLNPN
jgi:hypothetical protein